MCVVDESVDREVGGCVRGGCVCGQEGSCMMSLLALWSRPPEDTPAFPRATWNRQPLPSSGLLNLPNSQAERGPDLCDEVFVFLHEAVQVVLVLVDALQQVCPLKLQPAQLVVHLQGGRA